MYIVGKRYVCHTKPICSVILKGFIDIFEFLKIEFQIKKKISLVLKVMKRIKKNTQIYMLTWFYIFGPFCYCIKLLKLIPKAFLQLKYINNFSPSKANVAKSPDLSRHGFIVRL